MLYPTLYFIGSAIENIVACKIEYLDLDLDFTLLSARTVFVVKHVYIYTHTHIYMYIYMCVYMYIYMYICIYICIYVYIYTHIYIVARSSPVIF